MNFASEMVLETVLASSDVGVMDAYRRYIASEEATLARLKACEREDARIERAEAREEVSRSWVNLDEISTDSYLDSLDETSPYAYERD